MKPGIIAAVFRWLAGITGYTDPPRPFPTMVEQVMNHVGQAASRGGKPIAIVLDQFSYEQLVRDLDSMGQLHGVRGLKIRAGHPSLYFMRIPVRWRHELFGAEVHIEVQVAGIYDQVPRGMFTQQPDDSALADLGYVAREKLEPIDNPELEKTSERVGTDGDLDQEPNSICAQCQQRPADGDGIRCKICEFKGD